MKTPKMKTLLPTILFLFFQLAPTLAYNIPLIEPDSITPIDTSKSLFKNFIRPEALDFILTTDFKKLVKGKKYGVYQTAHFSYYDQDSTLTTLEGTVKARGHSRKVLCHIPPIKIKLKKEYLLEKGFQPYKTLKLVAPCKGANIYEKYLLKEFLAYQLWNIMTEYSFKTQLVRLHYMDTSEKLKPRIKYAFLIEHEKELAKRVDANIVKVSKCPPTKLLPSQASLMYVFQFMIGNTDYHVGNLHNLKILYEKESNKFIPVPYDFDYAGLVGTSYAIPHKTVPIRDVYQRYYKGTCPTEEELAITLELFRNKKEEIIEFCQEFEPLKTKDKKELLKYLEKFFKIIDNPKKVKTYFYIKC